MAMMVIIVVVVHGNVDTDINQTNTSAVTEMTPWISYQLINISTTTDIRSKAVQVNKARRH